MHGTPPLPLATIAAGALAALRPGIAGAAGTSASGGDSEPAFGFRRTIDASLEVDLLEPALDETFVAAGWRLPDGVTCGSGGSSFRPRGDAGLGARGPRRGRELEEIAALRRAAEAAKGDERAELAHRLAAACERAGDGNGAVAALRICIDSAGAGPLVGRAWQRLVELYARHGDPHAAARALIASADDPRTGALETERAATLVAAAEILRKRLGLPRRRRHVAGTGDRPRSRLGGGARGARGRHHRGGDFERLADVLERRLEVAARGPVEQQAILGRLAQLYAGPLAKPGRARDAQARAERIAGSSLRRPSRRRGASSRRGVPARPPCPAPRRRRPPAQAKPTPRPPAATPRWARAPRRAADLEGARQAYWRAASIEAEPTLRANYLVAHARVLLARGEVKNASGRAGGGPRERPATRRRAGARRRRRLPHPGLGPGPRRCTRRSRPRPTPPTSSRASAGPPPRRARAPGRRARRGGGALPRARDSEPAPRRCPAGAGRAGAGAGRPPARPSAGRRCCASCRRRAAPPSCSTPASGWARSTPRWANGPRPATTSSW